MTTENDEKVNKAITEMMGECWHEFNPTTYAMGKCKKCKWKFIVSTANKDYANSLDAVARAVEYCRKLWLEQDAQRTQYFRFTDVCDLGWRVDIDWPHHDGEISIAVGRDESLSRAICLAILKAMEIEL